ncbi:MAG: UpxY family transcription antiterminator [Chitinophagaceae bacterium]
MNTATTKQWYALYTRPKWEKRVTETLEKKKLEVYCPMNRVPRHWGERKKALMEPLFQSLIFVYASESDQERICETDGVINFIHWLNKPAIIRQEEIDTIRKFLNEYDFVSLEKAAVNLSEKVRIINGPLMMWEGQIVQVRTNVVKIMLPSLGYALVAEIREERPEKTVRPLAELNKRAV